MENKTVTCDICGKEIPNSANYYHAEATYQFYQANIPLFPDIDICLECLRKMISKNENVGDKNEAN